MPFERGKLVRNVLVDDSTKLGAWWYKLLSEIVHQPEPLKLSAEERQRLLEEEARASMSNQ
jgi:hypothetical protein